jgi:hypothetical protein
MLYPKVKWHEHQGVYSARYLGYTLLIVLFGEEYRCRVFDPEGTEVYAMSSRSLASMKTSCRNSAINRHRARGFENAIARSQT